MRKKLLFVIIIMIVVVIAAIILGSISAVMDKTHSKRLARKLNKSKLFSNNRLLKLYNHQIHFLFERKFQTIISQIDVFWKFGIYFIVQT